MQKPFQPAAVLCLLAVAASACTGGSTPHPEPTATSVASSATASPSPVAAPDLDLPFELVSRDSLYAYMEDLTAIQPHSGWRNAATEGEAEALTYVAGRLAELGYLEGLGLEIERQSFRVFNATELWETRLHLTVDGQDVEVPADGVRGYAHDNYLALRFDSDGQLNDSDSNPVVADGPVLVVRSYGDVQALTPADVQGKVVFLDYAAIDRFALDLDEVSFPLAQDLLALGPAGVVLVTSFSNAPGESHGTFVGDANAFVRLEVTPEAPRVPILFVRLEDLAPAGIADWDGVGRIEAARLTWAADVFSPATSGNLVARIPGADSSRAVILGAHIDSPNSPGAMDDGSGSAILLEVARVLDAARVQPAVDLYLVWFGSEEVGLEGSAHFVCNHQELLDRTLAMLQIDLLSHPLDGMSADITLTARPYTHLGDDRLAWPDYLSQAAARHGVEALPVASYYLQSDNAPFTGMAVPNANLAYESSQMRRYGPIHYATHIHDPYDTVRLAREVAGVFEEMTRVALAAALETGRDKPVLRVTPPPDRRALFVASHTEALHMSPVGFADLGQTLAMAGFDVDVVPYGEAVTPADLEDADMVVVPPVVDLPGQGGNSALYDEAWNEHEIALLEEYVTEGGFLVLTTSAHRLWSTSRVRDLNEDRHDVNALAARFGVRYQYGTLLNQLVWTESESPLVEGVSYLEVIPGNGIPFAMSGVGQTAQVLARSDGHSVIGLVRHGDAGGEVLVLADLGLLGSAGGTRRNLGFWQNLARYARSP